ncbi:MAG: DUF3516 domain-containing protein [Acidimicrobiales bacterium]
MSIRGSHKTSPTDAKTDEIDDLVEWLGILVRQVDSSLIDEWERLLNPAETVEAPDEPIAVTSRPEPFASWFATRPFAGFNSWRGRRAKPQHLARRRTRATPPSPVCGPKKSSRHYSPTGRCMTRSTPVKRSRSRALHYDADSGVVTQTLVDPLEHFEWRWWAMSTRNSATFLAVPYWRSTGLSSSRPTLGLAPSRHRACCPPRQARRRQ